MELQKIKSNINKKYLNNLLKVTNKKGINNEFIQKKLEELNKDELLITESSDKKEENLIYSDDYLYKKPWTRISAIHKIIKIKEFLNKLHITNKDNKKDLEKKLIQLIKNKTLTKKDRVNYDKINGQIISIPDLSYNKGIYKINI